MHDKQQAKNKTLFNAALCGRHFCENFNNCHKIEGAVITLPYPKTIPMLPTQFWAKPQYAIATLLCIVVLTISSCTGPSPRERQQARLLAKLDSSNEALRKIVHDNTYAMMINMETNSDQPCRFIHEKVKYWMPISQKIRGHALTVNKQINSIARNADNYDINLQDTLAKMLYLQMLHFKNEVLGLDPEISVVFKKSIIPEIDLAILDTAEQVKMFSRNYFENLYGPLIKASLTYWLNIITIVEYELIQYCCIKSLLGCNLGMEYSHTLVSQSSTSVRPGETLNIFAGVGNFSTKAASKIKINGVRVAVTDGVASYQLRSPAQKGKHSVNVEVTYLDQNGNIMTETKVVEYTVR